MIYCLTKAQMTGVILGKRANFGGSCKNTARRRRYGLLSATIILQNSWFHLYIYREGTKVV